MTRSQTRTLLIALFCVLAVMLGDLAVHSSPVTHVLVALHRKPPHPMEHLFWDTEPYVAGIHRYVAGLSPYTFDDPQNLLPFAYPPLFAFAGGALEHLLPPPIGYIVYLTIYLVLVVGLQLVFAVVYLDDLQGRDRWPLLLLAPLTVFMSTVFWSGNIHAVWWGAALIAALPGLRRNRWLPFMIVTLLASLNQPVFLSLLLLPLFAGKRQGLPSLGVGVLTCAGYGAQMVLCRELYTEFRDSVTMHLRASHDFGGGIFGALAGRLQGQHTAGIVVAAMVQIAVCGSILVALLVLRLRRRLDQGDPRWWALLVVAILLINPRLMPYDAAVGLIPAAFLLLRGTHGRQTVLIAVAVTAISIVLRKDVGFLPLLIAGFVPGVLWLARSQPTLNPRAAKLGFGKMSDGAAV